MYCCTLFENKSPQVSYRVDSCFFMHHTHTHTHTHMDTFRKTSIKDWDKTFYDITRDMENAVEAKSAYILNPVVGVSECVVGVSVLWG